MGMPWQEQVGINLAGAREVAAAAVEKDWGEEWGSGCKGRLLGRSTSKKYT